MEPQQCQWCGQEFKPSRSDGLFCRAACKQAYWRWKHRLNYARATIYDAINTVESYLAYDHMRKEAENVLGEIADRLHALGFEHDIVHLPLPAESYTLENQLGEKNE